jgi:hypothetical protein
MAYGIFLWIERTKASHSRGEGRLFLFSPVILQHSMPVVLSANCLGLLP